jgi:hypothetical protein
MVKGKKTEKHAIKASELVKVLLSGALFPMKRFYILFLELLSKA